MQGLPNSPEFYRSEIAKARAALLGPITPEQRVILQTRLSVAQSYLKDGEPKGLKQ